MLRAHRSNDSSALNRPATAARALTPTARLRGKPALRHRLAILLLGLLPTTLAAQNGYVADAVTGDVTVIDLVSGSLLGAFATGVGPTHELGVHPSGSTVYTTQLGGWTTTVDTASGAVNTVLVGASAYGLAIDPAGAFVLVADTALDQIYQLDSTTLANLAVIPVGDGPSGIALVPGTSSALVVNTNTDDVSVVDVAGAVVTATISVGTNPQRVAVTPNGAWALVTNSGSNDVSIIDVAANTVVATVPVGSYPVGIDTDPLGTVAVVANLFSGDVSIIDLVDQDLVRTVPTSTNPVAVTAATDNRSFYVTDSAGSDVFVVDLVPDRVEVLAIGGFLGVHGDFLAPPPVAASVTGVDTTDARCRTAAATIFVALAGDTTVDCEAAGLAVNSGDAVEITIRGFAH